MGNFSGRERVDVFISFTSADVPQDVVRCLEEEFGRVKHRIFFSDESSRSQDLMPKALAQAKILVIIFSQNYASHPDCLKEVVSIVESKRRNEKQKVIPLFYGVDPSDVRHQRGSFQDAFLQHERNFAADLVRRWREALVDAANFSGVAFSSDNNVEPLEKFVKSATTRSFRAFRKKVFKLGPKVEMGLFAALVAAWAAGLVFNLACSITGSGFLIFTILPLIVVFAGPTLMGLMIGTAVSLKALYMIAITTA